MERRKDQELKIFNFVKLEFINMFFYNILRIVRKSVGENQVKLTYEQFDVFHEFLVNIFYNVKHALTF